ncbi:MAG: hypothetical protein APR55_03035 [Methanolinea sp. SDB]|nr:MAG: hypothetical protein APR55_03035 [Methanolinea sp. SDB]
MAFTSSDVRIENLSKYLFNAPSWPRSMATVIILGLIIDGAAFRLGEGMAFLGTLAFTIPAITSFVLTKPCIGLMGRSMTWNRSALLALTCMVLGVIITLSGMVLSRGLAALYYSIALGFILGIRLLVLVAIADYRPSRMIVPASLQSLTGMALGSLIFESIFLLLALVLQLVFLLGFILLIWAIEQPLYRAFNVRGLDFLNSFIAHLTDGSRRMEDFFREIGEEVFLPQVTLFFRRPGKRGHIFTVPNVHPGPLGEIGGGNLPKYLQSAFDEMVMVPHGAATHDFNLVSGDEIEKIVSALKAKSHDLAYLDYATRSERHQHGSVSLLFQVIGDTLLLVTTRSPQRTEDLDFNVGMTIMSEGHRAFPNIAFVDAHNCLTGDISNIQPATAEAMEYLKASEYAIDTAPGMSRHPLFMGHSHQMLPYSREQGFGDQGLRVMVIKAGDQTTAYILFDGNNIQAGVREKLRDYALSFVDEAEVMTTDSHVVNTVSGKNPVGMRVPPEEFMPFVGKGIQEALQDLAPAEVAGATPWVERVVVFGSNRITQLASTLNTVIVFMPVLSLAILLLAFILSILAYLVIG